MKLWVQHTEGDLSPIQLEEKAFAQGGEGTLYKIKAPNDYQPLIAKIYHLKKQTKLRFEKIQHLQQNPPKTFQKEDGIQLVWPQKLLLDKNKKFVGFLMPKVEGEKLALLTLPSIPKKYRNQWASYDFIADPKRSKRFHLCYKIAKAIFHIHRSQKYLLIDMKPDNIMVNPQGNIALVDLDSVEVIKEGKTLYDAPVATPDYTPPDNYQKWEIDPTQEDPWDRFGLAVILYQLLLGIHPFAASTKGKFKDATSLYQKIEQGLYVHNPSHRSHFQHIPPLHDYFHSLPIVLQDLFNRCFINGHTHGFERPSSEEWSIALHEYKQHHLQLENPAPKDPIRLQFLPPNLPIDSLYKTPNVRLFSYIPQLEIQKKISPSELQNHHLPEKIQSPKEIRNQRFFNFIVLLLITLFSTIFSMFAPWYFITIIGIATYLGFNYSTYNTRKSTDKKEMILGIFNTQMIYFEDLIQKVISYEKQIQLLTQQISNQQQNTPKEDLENMLWQKKMLLEKITNVEHYIQKAKVKLKKTKREEKRAYKELISYYQNQIKKRTHIKNIPTITPLQSIILLQRAYRLQKLTAEQLKHYPQDLKTLQGIEKEFEIEQKDLKYKHSERYQDILFGIEEAQSTIAEEIRIYNLSISAEKEEKIKNYIQQQRISLSKLDRLQYDYQKLEKPVWEQVESCKQAKLNTELYKKISYPRHLLEMLGILRPF